jgi:hypothetical protein
MDPEQGKAMLETALAPWHRAIADPEQAQRQVLTNLLSSYRNTVYGQDHKAAQVETIDDYRQAFPVTDYEGFKSVIDQVMNGEIKLLLSEPPVGWAITRGTTAGESKFIPMTATDLEMRVSAGRAMMNYVATSGRFDLFQGVNLNLNFPSRVGTIDTAVGELEYGYSSGIYTRFVSQRTPIRSMPSQDEIDTVGAGTTKADWDARFELAYQRCKDQNVTLVGGVVTTAVLFGRYTRRRHGLYPKDIWNTQIMTLGSAPGINTHFRNSLTAMYGPAVIREIYGATEGMFGQQRDEKRAWVPNYDLFFLEVETQNGVKMLYEMKPGEVGELVVSTPILPRYKIGDLILAFKAPYFRCIGRSGFMTHLRYWWNEFLTMNLGRL